MRIPLDRESARPLYDQVQGWFRSTITSGGLEPGTRLPSSRELADQLGVSRTTIATAYAALETDGLILSRSRGGTFVAPPPSLTGDPDAVSRSWPLWQATHEVGPRAAAPPDLIAFTGVGEPREYPVAGFARAVKDVLRDDGAEALGYGDLGAGHEPLRRTIAQLLASQGILASADEILVTSGSQQALALVCSVLLRPGDRVLVEQPTYDHALDLFRSQAAQVVGVPVDADGMQVDLVEELLRRHRPRIVYTSPNFQNPSGTTMSVARRRALLDLAGRHGATIVEDDFVGDLRYDGLATPALKALDGTADVIYVGTFSKVLMPGVRVGYLLTDGAQLDALASHKRVHDLTTSPLMQRALDSYLNVGRYQAYLRRVTRLYGARRDAMLRALATHLPACEVRAPHGGLFCWVRLPAGVTASALVPAARDLGVEVAAGTRFFLDPVDGEQFVRLNFAVCTPEEIDRGVRRLARAVRLDGS